MFQRASGPSGHVRLDETECPREFEGIARKIQEALAEHDLPSVALAVAKDGEILWEAGFGLADREREMAATPHTLYFLGSISKPITATALMILVERGLIALDRPANAYLEGGQVQARVGDSEEATIRRLANHTAGLPLHYNYFYEDEPYRPPSMDETIRRYGNLVTAPGERYQYANLGFGILGHIIERVSGASYANFLREAVFLPLGLSRTSVWVPSAFAPYAAREYGGDNVGYPRKVTDHPGAGAVYASAHDLIRFAMFHLKQRQPGRQPILTDQTLDAMQIPTAHESETAGYGVGWSIDGDILGFRTVGHAGGSGGVSTQLLMVPTEGISAVVLTNSSRPNPYLPSGLTGDLVGALLPLFRERLAELRAQAGQASDLDASDAHLPLSARLIGRWRGSIHTYEQELTFCLCILASGEATAELEGRPMRVTDLKANEQRLTGVVDGMIPSGDASRRSHRLELDLTLRGEELNGAVLAMTPTEEEGGAPERRLGFALGHWTQLRK